MNVRRWAKACALLVALGATVALPATVLASGSETDPHSSDIKVSKKAVKAETAGETTTITWKVVVTNDGKRDLGNITLVDPDVDFGDPASSFDEHCAAKPDEDDKSDHTNSSNGSSCVDDPTLLQKHETLTYTGTQAMAKTCGWVRNTVKVTAEETASAKVAEQQSAAIEASATAKIFLRCPDFEVTKVAKASSYNQGATIEWIVTVTNTGNMPLSNPVLTDPGVTFGPPSSNMPTGSAKHAKSVRTPRSSTCEKKNSSKSPTSAKDDCKDNDDPECKDDDRNHSSKSLSKNDHCVKDDGVLTPGETLTYVGTQAANACGVVSNTVTVTVKSRPGKARGGDKARDGDAKYESSKTKAGARKKAVVKRSKKHKRNTPKPGDKPKDKPHMPPMPAVELTKTSVPATTFVVCEVVVTKTANVEFTRTFDWTITKSVDSTRFNVAPGGSATATYTVTATKSAPTDTGFKVAGSITVKSPYPTALPVTVTDQLDPALGTCTVAGSVASVPANGMTSFSYSCDVGNAKPTGTNTATAAFTVNGQPTSASGSAAVVVGDPTTVVNDSVTVTDAFSDRPIQTLFEGPISKTTTTTYMRSLTGPATTGCLDYDNVATMALDGASRTAGPITVTVCATLPPGTPQQPPPTVIGGPTPVPPVPSPRLRVTKTGPATAIAGQLVTYRITVSNRGTADALGVVLRDVVPSGFSVFGKVRGASVSTGAVRWRIGTLAPGQSRTVRATFRIDRTISGRRCNLAIATPSNGVVAKTTRCTRVSIAGATRIPGVTG